MRCSELRIKIFKLKESKDSVKALALFYHKLSQTRYQFVLVNNFLEILSSFDEIGKQNPIA